MEGEDPRAGNAEALDRESPDAPGRCPGWCAQLRPGLAGETVEQAEPRMHRGYGETPKLASLQQSRRVDARRGHTQVRAGW